MAYPAEELDNRIRAIREERGLSAKELAALCEAHLSDLNKAEIYGWVSLIDHRGSLRPLIKKLVRVLEVDVADMFPRQVCSLVNTATPEPDDEEAAFDRVSDRLLLKRLIKGAAGLGTPAQAKQIRRVLYLRFWMDMTLAEIGKQLGLTPERIRGLESLGLRRLRTAWGRMTNFREGVTPWQSK